MNMSIMFTKKKLYSSHIKYDITNKLDHHHHKYGIFIRHSLTICEWLRKYVFIIILLLFFCLLIERNLFVFYCLKNSSSWPFINECFLSLSSLSAVNAIFVFCVHHSETLFLLLLLLLNKWQRNVSFIKFFLLLSSRKKCRKMQKKLIN